VRWSLFTVDLVDHRASLLPEDKYIDQSFDPYAFLRNAWLQRREYQVHGDQSQNDVPPDLPPDLPPDTGDDKGGAPPPPSK
jgi:phospholipid-binding lipoprotein MlaA